jgi:hypothetical protein
MNPYLCYHGQTDTKKLSTFPPYDKIPKGILIYFDSYFQSFSPCQLACLEGCERQVIARNKTALLWAARKQRTRAHFYNKAPSPHLLCYESMHELTHSWRWSLQYIQSAPNGPTSEHGYSGDHCWGIFHI